MTAFLSTIYAKVTAQTAAAVATGAVTWVLVTYVFHGALPLAVATVLPAAVASVLGFVAGWLKKETHGTPPVVVPVVVTPPPSPSPSVTV
jgi:hypothetical protein